VPRKKTVACVLYRSFQHPHSRKTRSHLAQQRTHTAPICQGKHKENTNNKYQKYRETPSRRGSQSSSVKAMLTFSDSNTSRCDCSHGPWCIQIGRFTRDWCVHIHHRSSHNQAPIEHLKIHLEIVYQVHRDRDTETHIPCNRSASAAAAPCIETKAANCTNLSAQTS
jgi:hypothetical protein